MKKEQIEKLERVKRFAQSEQRMYKYKGIMKKQILITENWWKSIKLLNLEDRKEVLYAIVVQEIDGEQPSLISEAAATVWSQIAKDLLRRRQQRSSKRTIQELSPSDKTETEQSNEKGPLSPEPLSLEKEKKKEKDKIPKPLHVVRFEEAMERDYPNISRMPEPLTFDQYQRLVKRFPLERLKKVSTSLNGYKKISKYKSAYRTIVKWMKDR